MHTQFDISAARAAGPGDGAPSILDLIKIAPSRRTRAVSDKIAVISGRLPINLVGHRGLKVIEAGGLPSAVAIAKFFYRWREFTPCSEVASARPLAFATVGALMLDGLRAGRISEEDRVEAHKWSDDLKRFLQFGPSNPEDEEVFDHMLMLSELGEFDLHDLSRLLCAMFALVDRPAPVHATVFVDSDFVIRRWMQDSLFSFAGDLPEFDAPMRSRPLRPRRDVGRALIENVPLLI